jgi:hypothetical protein
MRKIISGMSEMAKIISDEYRRLYKKKVGHRPKKRERAMAPFPLIIFSLRKKSMA